MPQEHVLCDMLRVVTRRCERSYSSVGGDSNQCYGREVSDLPALHAASFAAACARAARASVCPRRPGPRAREHIHTVGTEVHGRINK